MDLGKSEKVFFYHNVKGQLMQKAIEDPNIQTGGNNVQIFVDISPAMVQKRRTFKRLLQPLQEKGIKY